MDRCVGKKRCHAHGSQGGWRGDSRLDIDVGGKVAETINERLTQLVAKCIDPDEDGRTVGGFDATVDVTLGGNRGTGIGVTRHS